MNEPGNTDRLAPPAADDRPSLSPVVGAPPVVATRKLVKEFGQQRVLDEIDLEIPAGSIVGLIGPSGCGKTTLVRILTGVLRPTSGAVSVLGLDPADFGTAERRRFGYMPQQPVLFPQLSLWGNLNFISSVYGMGLRRRRHHLRELLKLVDLEEHRSKKLIDCSGGMQRRLSLAATLVHDPELLFLDEPTAGVDPILRERFWSHFRELRDQGRTIVVPTQYVGEAVSCDLVAVMSAGRVLTVQPPSGLAQFAYGGHPLLVDLHSGWLAGSEIARLHAQPFVHDIRRVDEGLVIVVNDADSDTPLVQRFFDDSSMEIDSLRPLEPTFDDVFIRIIERDRQQRDLAAA